MHEPTRKNGRHIDYALHSVNLVPSCRHQANGVADHDLVFYVFPLQAEEACLRVAPPRKLAATEPVSQELWDSTFPLKVFEKEVRQGHVQSAWVSA